MATTLADLLTNPDLLTGSSKKSLTLALLKQASQPNPSLPGALLHGLSVGLMGAVEGADNRENQAAVRDAYNAMYGTSPAAAQATVSPPTAPQMPSPASSRVYGNNEVSPLDIPVMTDKEAATGAPSFVPDQYKAPVYKAAVNQEISPQLLASVLQQESGFNPSAVSPKGAQGIAQFMPATAQSMGINPLDPNQAIPASAAYLRQNIDKFGSEPQAVAAYNGGPTRLASLGGDIGRMPAETQKYVGRIMAGQLQPQPQPQQIAQANIPPPPVDDQRARLLQVINDPRATPAQVKAAGIALQSLGPRTVQQTVINGIPVQRNTVTGEITAAPYRQNYQYQTTPGGQIVQTDPTGQRPPTIVTPPGLLQQQTEQKAAEAGATTRAEAKAKQDVTLEGIKAAQTAGGGNPVRQDINRALELSKNWTTTGLPGQLLSNVPGMSAHNLQQILSGIGSNITIDKLQMMRALSPTGGALGNVSNQENEMLRSAYGSLAQSQTAEQFQYNLRRLKNIYSDVIDGPGNGPARETLDGTQVPAQAAQLLRQNPQLAAQFDAKYGKGAAAFMLGQ